MNESFVQALRERSRRGERAVLERMQTATDTTTAPSLARARAFVMDEVLPGVEKVADDGLWGIERSIPRPGTDMNEVVLVEEIRRLLLERGLRADVMFTQEHITLYSSWLPEITLLPTVEELKPGVSGYVRSSELRCTVGSDGKQVAALYLWFGSQIEQSYAPGYVKIARSPDGVLAASIIESTQVHVVDSPEGLHSLRIGYRSLAGDKQQRDPAAVIIPIDLREARRKYLERLSTPDSKK